MFKTACRCPFSFYLTTLMDFDFLGWVCKMITSDKGQTC